MGNDAAGAALVALLFGRDGGGAERQVRNKQDQLRQRTNVYQRSSSDPRLPFGISVHARRTNCTNHFWIARAKFVSQQLAKD